MRVRKTLLGALTGALATAAVLAGTAPAHAAYTADPDDTTFTPVAADLIGVGSDTSQHAVKLLADAYNAQTPTPAARVATFAATGGGTLPAIGDVNRPNGSGAGKALLYGAGNNTAVDFARSSSSLSDAEKAAGLQQIPFALDVLQMAVSNQVASHAPASLTPAQIVGIYNGTFTNWSQVGGTDGTIVPMIPQAGSGTRNFFVAQLKAMNGGVDVALAASVQEVQEHDPAPIQGNNNAIAPFSKGRAGLAGTALRLVNGWDAKRALYNVVRQADLALPAVQSVFGPNGFICSNAANSLIKAAGFDQLARSADGGVCGDATQAATTDFDVNVPPQPITTTTTVAASSTGAGKVTLTATVAASSTPEGDVEFFEGDTSVGTAPAAAGGVATLNLTGVAPGSHGYTAVFTPAAGTLFTESEDTTPATVTVKTTATITESFPAKVAAGSLAKGTVTVTLNGLSTAATGKVVVKRGTKTVGSGTLKGGKVTLTLDKLPKGDNKLVIKWGGDANGVKAKKSFTITQK